MEGALANETVDSSLPRSATKIGMMTLDRVSRHADDKFCQSMTGKAHNMTKKVNRVRHSTEKRASLMRQGIAST